MKKTQCVKTTEPNICEAKAVNRLNQINSEQYISEITAAAASGCALHQLYLDNQISEAHFHAGLAFAKLYGLAMRSFGIHNRVKTACKTWDQLYGVSYDNFSSQHMEAIWRYILKALDPIYHQGIPMRSIAFALVLSGNASNSVTLAHIKKTLAYLQTVWEKIEESPYRLGLFAYHQNQVYSKIH